MAIYWIILFVVVLFIEVATVNLVSIWFAIGALAAFLVSFVTDSVLLELLTFVVVSIVSLIVTLPLVKKFKNREKVVPTNLDRVIGKSATVTKDILPDKRLDIKFKIAGENSRVLVITPHGKEYEELCEAVL